MRLLEEKRLKDAEEEKKWKAVLLKLYLNQSLCSLRQSKPKLAITQSRKVMELDPKNVKAHFRLGQVCCWYIIIIICNQGGISSIVRILN